MWFTQLRALLTKGCILRRRRYCSTIFEMALPVLALLGVSILHGVIPLEESMADFGSASVLSREESDTNPTIYMLTSIQQYLKYCENSGYLVVVTSSDSALSNYSENLANTINAENSYANVVTMESESFLESYIRNKEYPNRPYICGAVVLDKVGGSSGNDYEYRIRMNGTEGWQEDYPQQVPLTTVLTNVLSLEDYSYADYYVNRGFNGIQNRVDAWMTNIAINGFSGPDYVAETNTTFLPFQHRMVEFPKPPYNDDLFVEVTHIVLGLFLTFAFVWPLQRLVKSLVEEKEFRIKELLFQMSTAPSAWFMSWLIIYIIMFAVVAGAITGITGSSVYANSESSYIFMLYFLFGMSIFAFGYMVQSVFSRASTASTMSTVVLLASYFGYYAIKTTASQGIKTLACISAPVCVAQGAVLAARFESNGLGVTSETAGAVITNFTFNTCIMMLVVDFFVYLVVGWYLERVVPKEVGVPEPFYFVFNPYYWFPSLGERGRGKGNVRGRNFPENYEPDPSKPLPKNVRMGLSVINLRKEFQSSSGRFVAVNELSVDMFKDQVFVLLGHNGAGKTTTINMLSGMYTTTSGDAIVFDDDDNELRISTEMRAVRENLGVCPQHDVLYPDLTVAEHIRLMARCKGVPSSEVEGEVKRMLEMVGLTEKENVATASLSGGQKRKLSISMAIVGNSTLVFLDEPTSGVDPYSRRNMWDIIRKAKKGRVIVLTTHFMDEADQLGDRIGIMEHGTLACCGSSLFLKNVYGVGYLLTLTLKPGADSRRIRHAIRDLIPDLKSRTSGGELRCRLPLASSKVFPRMMQMLDKSKADFKIESYGISVTTLEEVFLKVGAAKKEVLDDEDAKDIEQKTATGSRSDSHSEDVKAAPQKQGSVIQVAPAESKDETGTVTFDDIGDDNPAAVGAGEGGIELKNLRKASMQDSMRLIDDPDISKLNSVSIQPCSTRRQVQALFMKRFWNYSRDRRAWACTLVYPLVILAVGLGLGLLGIEGDQPALKLTPDMFNQPNYIPTDRNAYRYMMADADPSSAVFINASAATCEDGFGVATSPVSYDNVSVPNAGQAMQKVLACNWASQYKQSKYLAFVAYDTNRTFEGNAFGLADKYYYSVYGSSEISYGQIYWNQYEGVTCCNHTNTRAPFMIFYNSTGYHSPGVALNMANNAIGRNFTGNGDFRITTYNDPLPKTADEMVPSSVATGLLISIAFSIVPAFFAYFIVHERDLGAKHQQLISGVDVFAYWISSWMWDTSILILTSLLSMAVFAAFGTTPGLVGNNSGATITLMIVYSGAITSLSYVLSFLFSNRNVAQNVLIISYLLSGGMLAIVTDVLGRIASTKSLAADLKWIFRVLPSYAFANSMVNLIGREQDGQNNELWGEETVLYSIYYMAAETVVYFLVVMFIEYVLMNPGTFQCLLRQGELFADDEGKVNKDQDIVREEGKVKNAIDAGNLDMITLQGLRKVYASIGGGTKVAVRDMYFSVPTGQCFGFLGINGAGKSTTLNMLTGKVYPTSGAAFLNGLSITDEQRRIRRYLGYCPQFDAFLGTLTGRQNLTMFGMIKGIPSDILPSYVDSMVKLIGLGEYADRASGTYSGGNKRKLSVGIALMGNPPMVFLDEPSTGMDPAARRSMWELIQRTMSKRAVILTTHSMEECEALCPRIGIMVSGRLRCVGSAQHLRQRYGNGYQLDTRVAIDEKGGQDTVEALIKWTKKSFPETKITEKQSHSVKFRLPVNLGGRSLGEAFALIEENAKNLHVTEYALSEVSLEQIFIYFAKQQREEAEIDIGGDREKPSEEKEG